MPKIDAEIQETRIRKIPRPPTKEHNNISILECEDEDIEQILEMEFKKIITGLLKSKSMKYRKPYML